MISGKTTSGSSAKICSHCLMKTRKKDFFSGPQNCGLLVNKNHYMSLRFYDKGFPAMMIHGRSPPVNT